MKIGLVSCTSTKQPGNWPARELYWPSAIFRKSVLYCEHCYDAWYILSAKHHLVHPDQMLEYYQLAIGDLTRPQQERWGRIVSAQLRALGDNVEFFALAPAQYLRYLQGVLVTEVLAGLRQGERQHWMAEQPASFGISDW